jgi:Xaa-Pro aminopeptidase
LTLLGDITRTFPINGTFDKGSRAIYELVLKMQTEVIERLKVGADWGLLNKLAHEILVDGLKGLGLLNGSKEDIMNARVSYLFRECFRRLRK